MSARRAVAVAGMVLSAIVALAAQSSPELPYALTQMVDTERAFAARAIAVGWKACDLLSGTLGQLMKLNQKRIGFGDDRLGEGSEFKIGAGEFVPLADVPDYVWLNPRGHEAEQHFADIDIQDIDGGATLLDRCHANPADIAASVWKQYFDGFEAEDVGPESGCLPFRVWQIWEAMKTYLQNGDALRFVAAAGVLAHYLGDASQPLHCSFKHHGNPPTRTRNGRKYPYRSSHQKFKDFKKTPKAKIHAIYEQQMFDSMCAFVRQP